MAEPYESVLVRVENVEVTNPDPGFYNLEVDGVLLVEPFFMELGQHAMGTVFTSITGPLMYSFEAFRIRPRTQADLVVNDVGGG
jgi:hypothetical protein